MWFPDVAITLPPGGVDFSCHAGTVCRRSYVNTATYSSDPTVDIGGLTVSDGGGSGQTAPQPQPGLKDKLLELQKNLLVKQKPVVKVKPQPIPETVQPQTPQ